MRGNRLYPKKSSGRYYILTLLRKVNELVIPNLKPNSKVIDFGCGNMPYRILFENEGHTYKGVDFGENEDADLHFIDGRIPADDNSIDCIVSTQVLEHVENPYRYLEEAHRVIKENGTLILSTHGHWKYHPDPTDFWRWTKDGLEKTLRDSSFVPLHFFGLMGLEASGLQLFQDGVRNKIPVKLRGLFFRFILFLQVKLDKYDMNQKDTSVLYFVCKKSRPDNE